MRPLEPLPEKWPLSRSALRGRAYWPQCESISNPARTPTESLWAPRTDPRKGRWPDGSVVGPSSGTWKRAMLAWARMPDVMPDQAETPKNESHEVEWVHGMARGERTALAELYRLYAGPMTTLALRILRDHAEGVDLVHDVFLEAWRHAATFDPERGSVKSWLLLRTRSRALDRLRSPSKTRRVAMDEDGRAAIVDSTWPDAVVDANRLPAALRQLSETELEVLSLGYFEGLSSSEMADALGVPMGTVKSRTRSALNKLRMLWKEQNDE